MPESVNLYAPPKAQVEDVVAFEGEAYEIRREHIKIEATIRSLGTLNYLGGALLVVGGIALMFGGLSQATGGIPFAGLVVVFCLGLGAVSFAVGRGLRTFRPWARVVAMISAGLGILSAFRAGMGAPIGMLINGYILYLLLCKKGRRIFESDYPAIVAATPDVKNKTSVVVWIALGLLVLFILVLVGAGIAGGMGIAGATHHR